MDPSPPASEAYKEAVRLARGRAMLRDFALPKAVMRQGPSSGAEVILCPPHAVEVEWLLAQTQNPVLRFRFEGAPEEQTFHVSRKVLEVASSAARHDVAHGPVMKDQCLLLSLWNDPHANAVAGRYPTLHRDAITLNIGLLTHADLTTLRGVIAHESGHIVSNHAVRGVRANSPSLTRATRELEADSVATKRVGPEIASRHLVMRLHHTDVYYGTSERSLGRHPHWNEARRIIDPLRFKLLVDQEFHARGDYPADAERLARNFGTDIETLVSPLTKPVMADATRIDRPPTTPMRMANGRPLLPK